MTFSTAHISHPGGRAENQDAVDYLVMGDVGCWVLADGLGGHGGGATAAGLAVEAVLTAFRARPEISVEALRAFLRAAHESIERSRHMPGLSQMKSTIVVLLADSVQAIAGNIGDSRLYLFRGGAIEYQSPDHSVPGALVLSGSLPPGGVRFHEDRNRLLRSLGLGRAPEPAIHAVSLAEGDAFLLCSDGFWEYVRELEMIADLCKATAPGEWLRAMELRLMGGAPPDSDNFSAVAIFFRPAAAAARPAVRRQPARPASLAGRLWPADWPIWLVASLSVLLALLTAASIYLHLENGRLVPSRLLPGILGGEAAPRPPDASGQDGSPGGQQ